MITQRAGFTLIELLVVIAIIGVLSSVVLASLSTARAKARDAAAILGINELTTLMQMEYDETGSYANLQSCIWLPQQVSNCDAMFSGNYAAQARKICDNILANSTPVWGTPGNSVLICNVSNTSTKFSIMVALSNWRWYCSGSSGKTYGTSYWLSRIDGTDIQSDSSRWGESNPGCYYNP